ncbi:MAG: hypothetical protein R2748_26090 [Bryobacterales bacterium]
MGLYMVGELKAKGELGDADLMDNYVTFPRWHLPFHPLWRIERSWRGQYSALQLCAAGCVQRRDAETGKYRVNPEKMQAAVAALSEKILRLQGDGDYEGAARFVQEMGSISSELQADLDRLEEAHIPVDVYFEQGVSELGL